MQQSATNKIVIYLALLFILNIIQAVSFELSYDEAYYWIYSNFLSWGYYDHPPMVALLIKLGSIFGRNEFGVRIFFNLLSCLSMYFLWLMTNRKKPKLFILLTMSLPLVQSTGFLALPDTALLFFSVLFLFFVKDYINNDNAKNSLALSLIIPMLFYSKYHGLAVVLFTTMASPSFIKRRSFWIIVLATCILYLPHIYWQYTNDFISFRFHLFGRGEKVFSVSNIMDYLASQIAIFGMINFFLMGLLTKKIKLKDTWEKILAYNVYGFLVLLFFVSFRNKIEANWTLTACAVSVPLIMLLVDRAHDYKKYFYWGSVFSISIIFGLRLMLMLPHSFYEGKKIDRLNEVKGWQKRIKSIEQETKGYKLISDTYQIASKLSFYSKDFVPAIHFTSRPSHFSYLTSKIKEIKLDEPLYFLTPKKIERAIMVDTGYKDPIYIHLTTLNELLKRYNVEHSTLLNFKPKF